MLYDRIKCYISTQTPRFFLVSLLRIQQLHSNNKQETHVLFKKKKKMIDIPLSQSRLTSSPP